MGWWKINGPAGGIDWEAPCEGGGTLINAIPGRSTAENHYNGDGPVDIIEPAAAEVLKALGGQGKVERDALVQHLLDPSQLSGTHRSRVERMWELVNREYQRAWGRPPYPEEREAAVSFATGHLYWDD